MKTLLVTGLLVSIAPFLFAQEIGAIINSKEAERIEKVLASDEMRGRKAFSPDIEKAADFIASEFKDAGLKTWDNGNSFHQDFALARMKQVNLTATFEGSSVDPQRIVVVTSETEITIDQSSAYSTRQIKAGTDLFTEATSAASTPKNMIVLVDSSFVNNFPRLTFFKRSRFKSDKNIVFILGSELPKNFRISATHEVKEQKAANVVGVLPGKSKKDEIVIFSGHY